MRILIGVATFPTEPAVYAPTRDWLAAQNHPVALYGDDDPALSAYDNLTAKHNAMRSDLLDGDYDALLTVEADIIPPPDAIEKLCAIEADVAYGLVCARVSQMPLCFPQIDGFYGESIAHRPERWRAKVAAGEVLRSEGAGFGCTLIHRHVLGAVVFERKPVGRRNAAFADDWHFAIAVKAAGFSSAHHLGVLCGHIRRDGTALWPDAAAPRFCKVEPLAAANVSDDGANDAPRKAGRRRAGSTH